MAFAPHNGIYPSQWHLPPTMAFTPPTMAFTPPTMAFTPHNGIYPNQPLPIV